MSYHTAKRRKLDENSDDKNSSKPIQELEQKSSEGVFKINAWEDLMRGEGEEVERNDFRNETNPALKDSEKLDPLKEKSITICEENQNNQSEEAQTVSEVLKENVEDFEDSNLVCCGPNGNSSQSIEELEKDSNEENSETPVSKNHLLQDQPDEDLLEQMSVSLCKVIDCNNETGPGSKNIVFQENLNSPKQTFLQNCEESETKVDGFESIDLAENFDGEKRTIEETDEDLTKQIFVVKPICEVTDQNETGNNEKEIDPASKDIDCPDCQKFVSIREENQNNPESEEVQSCGGPNVNSPEAIEKLKEASTEENPDEKQLQENFTQRTIEEEESVDQPDQDLPKDISDQSETNDCQNEIVKELEVELIEIVEASKENSNSACCGPNVNKSELSEKLKEVSTEEKVDEKKICEDLIQSDQIVVQPDENQNQDDESISKENSSSSHTNELPKEPEESSDPQFEKSEPNLALINEILKHPMASQWQSTSHQPYVFNQVATNTDEYLRVKEIFLSTDNRNKIERIERVENPFLLGHYLLKKEKMSQTNGFVEERTVYHGTSEENIDEICELNFDWRRTGTSRGHKFGRGVSFAKEVSWADHYAPENVMILAKVLISKSIEGNRETVYPPRGYDTTQNAAGRVFVKYEDDDFFPQYVIHYKKKSDSDSDEDFW